MTATPKLIPVNAILTMVTEYLPGNLLEAKKNFLAIKKAVLNARIFNGKFNYSKLHLLVLLSFLQYSCSNANSVNQNTEIAIEQTTGSAQKTNPEFICKPIPAAYKIDSIVSFLGTKRVAVVGNHSSLIGKSHLVDSLLSRNINVVKVFAPEHGFRGDADAGETIKNGLDTKTGLPLISLYGKNRKPTAEQLANVDVILFDIQDVGVRYYTYISTMHYTMEAAAELGLTYVVLDRPNPNGFYIDGPILDLKYKSFVGMHPVPVVHGLTVGEYSKMIVGEGWLNTQQPLDLKVFKVENYSHSCFYEPEVRPSPNLPNLNSIYAYPSLGFFEGTSVSVGRGTELPFQQIGHPSFNVQQYAFTPKPSYGSANPPFNGIKCFGYKISFTNKPKVGESLLTFSHLVTMYLGMNKPEKYFNNFFANLMGTKALNDLILAGKSDAEIKAVYKDELAQWNNNVRKKYLLYKDFDEAV